MPDLNAATDAGPVQTTDQVILLRDGVAYTISVAELIASTFQAAITLGKGTLLGRTAGTNGAPQQLGVADGLAVAGGNVVANGEDHLGLNLLSWMDTDAELIVNSAGRPSRLPFAFLNQFLAASVGGVANAWLDQNGAPITDQNGQPILL